MSVCGDFLVLIFPHSKRIRRVTPYLPVFSTDAGNYEPEKLRIRTIFTKCFRQPNEFFILAVDIYTRALQTKILYTEAAARGVLWKKVFLKIYARQLSQSLFFLSKKRLWERYFLVNFAKILRTPFSQNIDRRLLLYLRTFHYCFL